MCFVLFAGARQPLLESEWDESYRRVFVRQIDENEQPVRHAFAKESVQYVGSSLNCGCGFRTKMQLEDPYFPDEDEAEVEKQQNHAQLVASIRPTIDAEGEIVFFGCWWGEWEPKDLQPAKVTLTEFASEDFAFVEGYRYLIVR
jgi:hypothetical protein